MSTKHQAWLFLPLFAGIAWQDRWPRRAIFNWLAGVGFMLVVLLLWSLARGQADELWLAQLSNAGGLRLAWSWEVWSRLPALGRLFRISLGWPLLLMSAVVLGPLIWSAVWGKSRRSSSDAILLAFVLGYLAFHWLTAVPVWDRYLLPILPLIAVLTGRGLVLGYRGVTSGVATLPVDHGWVQTASVVTLFGLILMATLAALPAREGRLPVGGRPAADEGAAMTAALLADAPYGTVLYDHFYSWHWRYQLFDGKVYVSWFPDAAALIQDLNVFADPSGERYLVLPATPRAAPIVRSVIAAGYGLEEVAPAEDGRDGMRLYRILPSNEVGS